jgi:hypothetical protein
VEVSDFIRLVFAVIGVVLLVFFASILSGIIVYFVWPVAINAAFPGLVDAGIIAKSLTFWQSVCLSWLFGSLIKSTNTTTNKKN